MSIVIHHNPDCGTSRNVLAIIEASGETPMIIEYLETGWTRPQALSEQNSKYLERPSNRSDRPGKMQENQWPRNPVLTFWQSKRICSDNAPQTAPI